MKAAEVYEGSNGDVTTAYYAELEKRGPIGIVALNLFRAQKCSHRAKLYRRRAHKGEAYDRKNWSMGLLCTNLVKHAAEIGIVWGWKIDPEPPIGFPWVLYVDLPQGQVSFHSRNRGEGPDYAGEWCGQHQSAERIIAFCDAVYVGEQSAINPQPAPKLPEIEWKQEALFSDVRSES